MRRRRRRGLDTVRQIQHEYIVAERISRVIGAVGFDDQAMGVQVRRVRFQQRVLIGVFGIDCGRQAVDQADSQCLAGRYLQPDTAIRAGRRIVWRWTFVQINAGSGHGAAAGRRITRPQANFIGVTGGLACERQKLRSCNYQYV